MRKFQWRYELALILALILILVISGCSQKPPDIRISDIIAIPSPIMKGVVSVFMRISNDGGSDHIIDARTDVNGSIVELHDIKDGRMVKIKDVKIPEKGKVEMIPGGLHIMIFNLPDAIMNGDAITLHLRFKRSGERSIEVKVLQKSANEIPMDRK